MSCSRAIERGIRNYIEFASRRSETDEEISLAPRSICGVGVRNGRLEMRLLLQPR